MPYAIEMYFDAETDLRIRALWKEFASIGAPFMNESGARPHVSLAVCESVNLRATCELLARFAGATARFPIAFTSLGMFPAAKPVAFLAPKVTPELLALHARFFSEFATTARDCWSHYSPSQWVPHCTLTMNLEPHQVARALDMCRAAGLPLLGTVTEIGMVEFPSIKQLYAAPFAIRNADSEVGSMRLALQSK